MEDSTVDKDSVERNIEVRFIDYREIIKKSNGQMEEKIVRLITTDENMSAKTAWRIIHKRWDIENTCFRRLRKFKILFHKNKATIKHEIDSLKAELLLLSFCIRRKLYGLIKFDLNHFKLIS